MKQRDIWKLQLWGATLFSVACFLAFAWLLALIPGCGPLPEPVEPDPQPAPDGTPCERACLNAVRVCCDGDEAQCPVPRCTAACERYETLGGSSSRNPECQARAGTCEELEGCRGGT